jgi:hypothetical protein
MVVSCVSHSARKDPTQINWHERVGTYTYRQAQADFGVPSKVDKSPEGITAEWLLRPTPGTDVGTGSGFSGSQSASQLGSDLAKAERGEKLRLKFGPDGKLIE